MLVKTTISGYIVDVYCFNRCVGKSASDNCALDATHVLYKPEDHTVHCLKDPPECVKDGYYVAEKSGDKYGAQTTSEEPGSLCTCVRHDASSALAKHRHL